MANPKITPIRKDTKMRSSPEARRLLRAYVKCYGSQHRAAKKLGMTQAQLNGLLTGRLKDTPAMRIAIDRADARSKRAWLKVNGDNCKVIDAPATLRAISRAQQQAQTMIDALLKLTDHD